MADDDSLQDVSLASPTPETMTEPNPQGVSYGLTPMQKRPAPPIEIFCATAGSEVTKDPEHEGPLGSQSSESQSADDKEASTSAAVNPEGTDLSAGHGEEPSPEGASALTNSEEEAAAAVAPATEEAVAQGSSSEEAAGVESRWGGRKWGLLAAVSQATYLVGDLVGAGASKVKGAVSESTTASYVKVSHAAHHHQPSTHQPTHSRPHHHPPLQPPALPLFQDTFSEYSTKVSEKMEQVGTYRSYKDHVNPYLQPNSRAGAFRWSR